MYCIVLNIQIPLALSVMYKGCPFNPFKYALKFRLHYNNHDVTLSPLSIFVWM